MTGEFYESINILIKIRKSKVILKLINEFNY